MCPVKRKTMWKRMELMMAESSLWSMVKQRRIEQETGIGIEIGIGTVIEETGLIEIETVEIGIVVGEIGTEIGIESEGIGIEIGRGIGIARMIVGRSVKRVVMEALDLRRER